MDFQEFKRKFEQKKVIEFPNAVGDESLVSVCVQTYQHVQYIRECLEGILKQKTSFSFEILVGEDESSDGTREICKEYANRFPEKIRLFLHHRINNIKVNGIPTGRFNFLNNIYSSKGKYIALCEGDDYWTDPLKLQKQVEFLEENRDINICFHRAYLLEKVGQILHEIPSPFYNEPFEFYELLKHYNFITFASVLYRNPKVLQIPQWFIKISFGDLGLYKIISRDKKIKCLDEAMSTYRIHNQGLWSSLTILERNKQYLQFYFTIYNFLLKKEQIEVRKKFRIIFKELAYAKYPSSSFIRWICFSLSHFDFKRKLWLLN